MKRILGLVLTAVFLSVLCIPCAAVDTEERQREYPGFADVAEGSASYDAIKLCYERGLMNGTSDTVFNPQGKLTVDQSALNGESRETAKLPGGSHQDWDFSRQNQLFRGSVVCQGQGILQVRRVGDATFYGGMARDLQQQTRQSPLKLRLSQLADSLSRLGVLAALAVGGADLCNALVIANAFAPDRILAALADLPHLITCLLHAATLAVTVDRKSVV